MEEYELLLRHAAAWARGRKRTLDAELVALTLRLRADHDDLPANQWPAGSAEHLMLVRWPAHGPSDSPDVDALVQSLDTLWSFLRSTGRMAAASAQPAQLRREAKKAAPKMAAACADESRFGTAKQLLGFGSGIGINLDDVPDLDEANRRMQHIVEAWNAQPDELRLQQSEHWPISRLPSGEESDDGADWHLPYLDPAALPDSPLFRFDERGALLLPEPLDRAASAAQARASGFVRSMLALAEWVGDGKAITATDTLRPAVAKQAYADLKLNEWDRLRAQRRATVAPDRPRQSVPDVPQWRSATESYALERLWRPALSTGLIALSGRTARFDPSAVPTDPDGWVRLFLQASVPLLAGWDDAEYVDLAIVTLTHIDAEYGEPIHPDDLADLWWDSPANTWRGILESDPDDEPLGLGHDGFLHDISDQYFAEWIATFADHGLWRHESGRLMGTELGRDVLIILVGTLLETE